MLSDFPAYPIIAASDLARARRFYEETLEFEVARVTPAGVFYRTKDSLLFLYGSAFAGTNKATAASFQLVDLPATVAALKSRGVRFDEFDLPDSKMVDGILPTPMGLSAWFKDTEDNIIGLVQLDQPIL